MCFVWISEQTAIISLYSINWLVFITETKRVYYAVRAQTFYKTPFATQPSHRYRDIDMLSSSKHKTRPKCRTSSLSCKPSTAHFAVRHLLHLRTLQFVSRLPLPEGRAGTARDLSEQQTFLSPAPPPPNNTNCSVANCNLPSPALVSLYPSFSRL
jgi:hypothetical protein